MRDLIETPSTHSLQPTRCIYLEVLYQGTPTSRSLVHVLQVLDISHMKAVTTLNYRRPGFDYDPGGPDTITREFTRFKLQLHAPQTRDDAPTIQGPRMWASSNRRQGVGYSAEILKEVLTQTTLLEAQRSKEQAQREATKDSSNFGIPSTNHVI